MGPLLYMAVGWFAAVIFHEKTANNKTISLAAQEQIKINAQEFEAMAAMTSMDHYIKGDIAEWWAKHKDNPCCQVHVTEADVERIKQQILQRQALATLATFDQSYLPQMPVNRMINITNNS